MLVALTSRWRWQVTQPLATKSRRPRSASASGRGARASGAIALMGSRVVVLFPKPLWIVIAQSPVSGSMSAAGDRPPSVPGVAAAVVVRGPGVASALGWGPAGG